MRCRYCRNECIKKGKIKGIQRYQCKICKKYQQAAYSRQRIAQEKYEWVRNLNNEGNSISGIGRLLKIAKSSVQRIMERLVLTLRKPAFNEEGESYEIDEVRTFCGNKQNEIWLIYAINRRTKQVIDFIVGGRTKENIQNVLNSVLKLRPKYIYSDGLNIYKSLIKSEIHKVYLRCTNYIERKNLTLRTQLKPLNRKTLCFTRSATMLHCKFHLWAWKPMTFSVS